MEKEISVKKNQNYAQNFDNVNGTHNKSPELYFSISPGAEDSKDDSADPGTAIGITE